MLLGWKCIAVLYSSCPIIIFLQPSRFRSLITRGTWFSPQLLIEVVPIITIIIKSQDLKNKTLQEVRFLRFSWINWLKVDLPLFQSFTGELTMSGSISTPISATNPFGKEVNQSVITEMETTFIICIIERLSEKGMGDTVHGPKQTAI